MYAPVSASAAASAPRPVVDPASRLDWDPLPDLRNGLFLILSILFVALPTPSQAATLIVDPENGPYTTIESAVQAAVDGDVIEVEPGTYRENLVIEDKRLTLFSTGGAEVTSLDGEGTRILRLVDTDLQIEGFTFLGGRARCGGAIAAVNADLTVVSCVFRDNLAESGGLLARSYGGAIYLAKDSRLDVSDSSFLENTVDGLSHASGAALAYTVRDWAADGSGGDTTEWDVRSEIRRSSFLRNDPVRGSVLYFEPPSASRVERSLFVGEGLPPATSSILDCCLLWNLESPQVGWRDAHGGDIGRGDAGGGDAGRGDAGAGGGDAGAELMSDGYTGTNLVLDPRLCPDDPTRMHRSSPARTLCGGVGSTPIGCMGALVLAALPERLPPRARQSVDVYGYALDRVDAARLVYADDTYISSTYSTRVDAWLRFDFDLRSARPGPRALELWADGALVVREEDAVFVDTVDPRRFRPAWIEEDVPREVDLILGDTAEDFELSLIDPEGSSHALTSMTETANDTLRVGLPALPAGVYGLRLRYAQGDEIEVEAMLRVGTAPIRRVPEDYPTPGEAIAASDAGDEILVAPGRYEEAVVIDRPLRIRGIADDPEDAWISLFGNPGARGIHVLRSAGRIVEIARMTVAGARIPGGRGAGIYAEVPVRIAEARIGSCRSEGEDAIGGGIWAAPGSEIIDSRLSSNSVRADWVSTPDPFVEPSGGTAGGIYAVGCRVERCRFLGNGAQSCGEAVVDGLFLDNLVESGGGGYGSGAINSFALRGRVQGNRFDHGCGASAPYAVFFGPSEVDHNTFTDWWWDLCSALSLLQIQGEVDFHHNSLAGVGLMICRQNQAARPDVGEIRVWANLIESTETASPLLQYCQARLGPGPVYDIPLAQVEFGYNVGHPIAMFHSEGADDCGSCVIPMESVGYCEVKWHDGYHSYGTFDLRPQTSSPALPSNFPEYPDTLGALTAICGEVNPVFLELARVDRTESGVVLEWSFSSDIEIIGVGVERRELSEGASFQRIGAEWLPDCSRCSVVDDTADPGTGYEYVALVLYPDGDIDRVPLGQVSGEPLRSRLLLGAPRPNPATDQFSVPFQVPGDSWVVLELVDAGGRRIETLWDGVAEAGAHLVGRPVVAAPLPSGVYWLRLRGTDGTKLSQRLVVVR